ncbi:hypothetical protein ACFQY8_01375 [Alloscardovia venturai]|uniref:Uncharacterized protein n=1 Tax=Alloscardovia venturai TaxID=1769421 RepID=A0ABW2Y4J5_9BIFI
MAKRSNTKINSFSDEWEYVNNDGVRALISRRTGSSTFAVKFSHIGSLKLTDGDYEIQTDSKYIPHAIINQIIEDDIKAARNAK